MGFVNGVATRQQVRDHTGIDTFNGTEVVIEQSTEYTFRAEFCTDGRDQSGVVDLVVQITNFDARFNAISSSFEGGAVTSFSSNDANQGSTLFSNGQPGNATCGIISVTVPHYHLFALIGVNTFTFTIDKQLG